MVYKIVYKTIAALLALSVIPIAIYAKMIQFVGSISIGDSYVGEHMSLYEIYELFFGKNAIYHPSKGAQMSEKVRETMPWLITSGAFLAAALLVGIATAVVAVCCRKKLPTLILSAVGCMTVIGLFRAFKAFAAPYLDGTINLGDLGILGEGFLSSIASNLFKLEILQISSAGFLMFGAFGVLLLWTAAFMLVEIGETKPARKN